MIRPARNNDAQAIVDIFNYYIVNSTATFEQQPLDKTEIGARIQQTESHKLPYIVCEKDGLIVGYAYASKWQGRCAYQFSVEVTVYLAPQAIGEGHGTALYEALFFELRKRSLHVAIAGIALPNPGSVALHEAFGMNKVAHFEEVGFKFGAWVDVGYWHCKLA